MNQPEALAILVILIIVAVIYDGKARIEEFDVPLKAQDRGIDRSVPVAVTDLVFRRTNQDYFLDWHRAPRRQFVVTLSG